MPNNSFTHHGDWFDKAEEDRLAADILLREGGSFGTICFLCQQAAEKYLKGFLVSLGLMFPKTHDLLGLETLLLEKEPGIGECHEDLKLLNRYYLETRYPGDCPEFSSAEASLATQAALHVKEFVLAKIQV
ncbi:MAG: HEPN domain-containing protein [Candidatus Liptonbacteria bacterium]|nr:HEPN domain-containing protein [Candidatus Liptonbacteria bacterium]